MSVDLFCFSAVTEHVYHGHICFVGRTVLAFSHSPGKEKFFVDSFGVGGSRWSLFLDRYSAGLVAGHRLCDRLRLYRCYSAGSDLFGEGQKGAADSYTCDALPAGTVGKLGTAVVFLAGLTAFGAVWWTSGQVEAKMAFLCILSAAFGRSVVAADMDAVFQIRN